MLRKYQPPSDEHMRDLPLVEAPGSIWASIETTLDAGERPRMVRRSAYPIWQMAVAVVCLVIVASVYRSSTGWLKPRWEVVRVGGAPSIGAKHIGATDRIGEGEWLETDASSRAVIHVGAIGTVEVDSNTRVRLIAARPTEHRLALARGRITASVSAPPRLFYVDTASGTAVDLGCAYTMNADDAGNGFVQVTLGWISLERSGKESLVPAGASCRTRADVGAGTPFFDDATEPFKQALAELDFGKGGTTALETVLQAARLRDTLTLWHLLSRVDATDRLRVYTRMIALAPLPAGISPAKALELDPETLKHWREELAWKW